MNTQALPDWKIFTGHGQPHADLKTLPAPPPWRFAVPQLPLEGPQAGHSAEAVRAEAHRAAPFLVDDPMRLAVNAALYLRRPLLLTGRPGTGKSSLIAKVAHELQLGPVLRWPINSRSTVRSGVYEYDAVGRLQAGRDREAPVQEYLKLGPLGTALTATVWPRALLIDEIDKSDLDFANDLLNVIEEGSFEIPELRRLGLGEVTVDDFERHAVTVAQGRLVCRQFPFVVMTSNAEREFPAPFLRRCVRLAVEPPSPAQLASIVDSHLAQFTGQLPATAVQELIAKFTEAQRENQDVSTDQLLNAVFLTIAMKDAQGRSFGSGEIEALRKELLRPLTGQGA